MRPFVSPVEEFARHRALGATKRLAEHVIPGVGHHAEQGSRVPLINRSISQKAAVGSEIRTRNAVCSLAMQVDKLSLNEWPEAILQEVHRRSDPVTVGGRHCSLLARGRRLNAATLELRSDAIVECSSGGERLPRFVGGRIRSKVRIAPAQASVGQAPEFHSCRPFAQFIRQQLRQILQLVRPRAL